MVAVYFLELWRVSKIQNQYLTCLGRTGSLGGGGGKRPTHRQRRGTTQAPAAARENDW